MPPLTDDKIRRNVIRQWILGFSRDTIAEQNNIGAGTVSSIVANYKVSLEELDFDSTRQLAIEARQHGLNLSDLASHFRLYNYFIKSGAAEDKIESFIDDINSSHLPPDKVVALVNQVFAVSSEQLIPLDQVPNYIKEKLEEKQKIDDQIKEADVTLQSKNVSIETINEHVKLNEKLNEYNLSFEDIDKLLNVLINAKENGFDGKKIVGKLRSIKRLEKKRERLKNNCDVLSKQADKYKGIIPLAQLIWDLRISKNELKSFKIAVCEAAELFGFPRSTAAVYVLNNLRDYNKKGQLKKELSSLYLQKYALDQACSRHSQVIMALTNLRSYGISEDRILYLNDLLEKKGYNIDMKSTVELDRYRNSK
jgi:hypothetical protein